MLNDIQAVDSDRSNLVKFADVLALSVLVKGTQDKTPQKSGIKSNLVVPTTTWKPY